MPLHQSQQMTLWFSILKISLKIAPACLNSINLCPPNNKTALHALNLSLCLCMPTPFILESMGTPLTACINFSKFEFWIPSIECNDSARNPNVYTSHLLLNWNVLYAFASSNISGPKIDWSTTSADHQKHHGRISEFAGNIHTAWGRDSQKVIRSPLGSLQPGEP